MIDYGKLIKDIRTAKKLTQVEFAEITGLSQGYIHKIETGQIQAPSIKLVAELVIRLDVNPYAFILPGTNTLFMKKAEEVRTLQNRVNKLEKLIRDMNAAAFDKQK